MKRHLRVTVERTSMIGQLIARCGWHDSGSIGTVALRSFEPDYRVWEAVSATLSDALGITVDCRCSAIRRVIVEDRLTALAPHPAMNWLDGNAGERWLITHGWGDQSAHANVWFEDLADATLFRTAGFGARQ